MVLQALTAPISLQFLAFASQLLSAKPFSLCEMLSLHLNLSYDSGLNSILILLPLTPQQTSFPSSLPLSCLQAHLSQYHITQCDSLQCSLSSFSEIPLFIILGSFSSPSPATEYKVHNIKGLLCFI